jgi:hypothetical protein
MRALRPVESPTSTWTYNFYRATEDKPFSKTGDDGVQRIDAAG